jgi:hypothetical protein
LEPFFEPETHRLEEDLDAVAERKLRNKTNHREGEGAERATL